MIPPWAEREPDEDPEDWLLRLVISRAAIENGGLVPNDRNVPVIPAGTAFMTVAGAPLGWVTFCHFPPDPIPVPGRTAS